MKQKFVKIIWMLVLVFVHNKVENVVLWMEIVNQLMVLNVMI